MPTFAIIAVALLFTTPDATRPPARPAVADCGINQLSLSFDRENGNFDGMSHSGALLVIRNFGDSACRVPGRPALTFQDAGQQPVALQLQTPVGMHPGPVIVPVTIPAGAEATAEMRWVSNDVYDGGVCVSPASAGIAIAGHTLFAPLLTTICGPAAKPPTYTQAILHRDPPLRP